MTKRVVFEASAFSDFTEWVKIDKKIHQKIVTLIKDIDRSSFSGLGKPEPLKYELSGYWSRRINMTLSRRILNYQTYFASPS